jgi:hypothetical protein
VSRAALALAAAWLGFLVASWLVASASFATAERLTGEARVVERLPAAEDRRALLRHAAAELNRWMFRTWGLVQTGLGLGLVVLLWRAPGWPRWLAAAALLATLGQAFGLAGPIAALGRAYDFAPRPLPPDLARPFGLLHAAYVGLDLAKAALLAAAIAILARRG